MTFVSNTLSPPGGQAASPLAGSVAPTARPAAPTLSAESPQRWWRVPMVWVVIAGPMSVVVASLLTAVIAWRHIDPVILDPGSGRVIGHAGDESATPKDPAHPLAPALRARNHSATSHGTHDDAGRL